MRRQGTGERREATLRWLWELIERKASAAKRGVDQDMVAREESVSEVGSDAESGWSGVSDNSSTDSQCTDLEASSIASDQDRFDTACEAFRDLANDLYYIDLRRYSRGITSEDAAGVFPLGHACSQLALDLTIRGTGHITTPLHSLGDCNEVGVLFNSLSSPLLLSRKYYNFESHIATLSFVFADRMATARTTTFVEPCSIQIKKRGCGWCSIIGWT